MKIEKINDTQIRCTLTFDDLKKRDIELDDLAYGGLKAKKLFQEMMKQAYVKYGFDGRNVPLIIEAIPTAQNDIILNISKVDDPDELDTRFARFTPLERDYNEEDVTTETELEFSKFDLNSISDKLNSMDSRSDDVGIEFPSSYHYTAYFFFDELSEVIKASKIVSPYFYGNSSLLKIKDRYVLMLQKQDMSNDDFSHACNVMADCGFQDDPSFSKRLYYSSSSSSLITGRAIERLSKL